MRPTECVIFRRINQKTSKTSLWSNVEYVLYIFRLIIQINEPCDNEKDLIYWLNYNPTHSANYCPNSISPNWSAEKIGYRLCNQFLSRKIVCEQVADRPS